MGSEMCIRDSPKALRAKGSRLVVQQGGFRGADPGGQSAPGVLFRLPSKPALSFESGDDFMLPVGTYPNMNRIRVWCAFVLHWFFSHRIALHSKSVSADGTPLGGPPSHFACENTYQNACRCFKKIILHLTYFSKTSKPRGPFENPPPSRHFDCVFTWFAASHFFVSKWRSRLDRSHIFGIWNSSTCKGRLF